MESISVDQVRHNEDMNTTIMAVEIFKDKTTCIGGNFQRTQHLI